MAAVAAARHFAFGLRDFCLGFLCLWPYLGSLLRHLFRPASPALAGFPADGAVTAPASPPAAPPPCARSAQPPPTEVWRPRQAFVSNYLSGLDTDNAAPAIAETWQEPVPPRPASERLIPAAAPTIAEAWQEPVPPRPASERPVPAAAMAEAVPEAAEPVRAETVIPAPAAPVAPQVSAPESPRPLAPPPVRPAAPPPPPEPSYEAPRALETERGEDPEELAGYQLPPLELLDPPGPPVVEDQAQSEARSRILEQTLSEFRIEGKVVHIERGPRVTMFEISLAPGIRLNKVTSLSDNLAMQLQAESVRIIAPIPGKNTIGIEIPNTAKELVSLREIVCAVNREKRRQALPICLGKDVSGQALVADLTRMPHLLIAGATGSGKSVCINSIILSVLACCRPDEAQLIMVDPKVVELSRFKDIPHLMSPVITDMKRAVAVLEWICLKMDERYEQMSQVSVNNIAKFNAIGAEGIRARLDAFASLEEIEAFPKRLPYMVVIIDELADLMMMAGKDVEQHITRLAAKSRAVGIHLILATQRPSVDVITGLIKANMPCRIAFQVACRVDSRTILDQNGAETLLGQGDMLYLPPGVGKLTRAQGVFVSDEELFRVVDFVKSEAAPRYHPDLLGPVIGSGPGAVDTSSFDELFLSSGEAIIESQRGSVSLLQRKFGIGYGRASRIIDQLSSVGLLGPFRDGKAREILLTLEEFRTKFGGGASGGGEDSGLAGLRDDERGPEEDPWEEEERE
ncbi:MAG: DNA translocase FtsK, partial [Planctomycetota bacterium]|jgi:S-DNA-T family DNA segregation ATPase FtsK/SpoIIIE|nr:DNA translocase FtsK [Planctomycetota bacterium]